MAYIEIEDLIKVYKSKALEVVALRGLYMAVEKGEIVAIMGPSGSGKTTLLNILGGLDIPTAGTVIVNGGSLTGFTEKEMVKYRRDGVGFVFQFFNLVPTLNAWENIELPLRFAGVGGKKRTTRVDYLIDLVGLKSRRGSKPDELSGGEQQRIAMAVALANDPELILADEPTGELDTETGKQVLSIFKDLKEKYGKTIIIVTHDERVAQIADKMCTIVDGTIKEEKGKKSIKTKESNKRKKGEINKSDSAEPSKLLKSDNKWMILPIEGTDRYLKIEIVRKQGKKVKEKEIP
ncbi:MAG: ABC transporter ATP-binding protein [Candidatus Thermoplasmatota archaeon]|nr:ABC transporter ATP-binding protein [Candidatus Thermoplasmatota archaeon]